MIAWLKSNSISIQLLRVVLSIYLVITLIVTLAQVVAEYVHTRNMVAHELTSVEDTFSSALRTALWELNHDQLRAIEEAILDLPAVTGLTVRGHDQRFQVDSLGTQGEGQPSISHRFSLSESFQGETIPLADVTLYSSRGVVLERLKVNYALIVLNAAIKSAVLVALFIWAFRKYLSRPITSLTRAIDEVDLDHLDRTSINLDIRNENELKQLERSYNEMLHKLAEEKAVSDRSQKAAKEELEQEVEKRTQELEALNQRLEHLATTDSLTGVYNRRSFEERARQEVGRADREGEPLSLVIMDLDHFKWVNDRHGHAVGDEVLKDFVATVSGLLRRNEPLFRVGGEEFVVLMPAMDRPAAREVANRIRAAAAERAITTDSGLVNYTVSIGVATVEQGVADPEALLQAADRALYRAKEGGRNRVAV